MKARTRRQAVTYTLKTHDATGDAISEERFDAQSRSARRALERTLTQAARDGRHVTVVDECGSFRGATYIVNGRYNWYLT